MEFKEMIELIRAVSESELTEFCLPGRRMENIHGDCQK